MPYGKKHMPPWLRCVCCMGGRKLARDARRNTARARREGRREVQRQMEGA